MSNCKNCGKPLIVSEGKCVYCGTSVQGIKKETDKKTPWYKKLSLKKSDSWTVRLLRKSIISTLISLLTAIVMIIVKPWPGCLISIAMLLFAIITGAYGIIILQPDMDNVISDMGESKAVEMLNHVLNLILIWGWFFFIVGVVCLFIAWWAVLVAEIIGFLGLMAMLTLGLEALD